MNTSSSFSLQGLWVPIVTPFDPRGHVDLASLRRLADRLLGDGVAGLVALGTTGEPATLTAPERRRVVETCDAACRAAGRGLIVGAGTNSTHGTIEEVQHLTEGIAALATLVVVPYYTRPSERAVVEHLTMVADATDRPVVAYNIPYRTGRGLGASALLELSTHPLIIGVKQAVGALDVDTLEVLARCGPGFALLAGDDAFITPTIAMGGAGAIAASAHLCTPRFVEMTGAALAGDLRRANELAAQLLPLVTLGFSEPSPAVFKGALARRGEIAGGELRRPMTSAPGVVLDRILDVAARIAPNPDAEGGSPERAPHCSSYAPWDLNPEPAD